MSKHKRICCPSPTSFVTKRVQPHTHCCPSPTSCVTKRVQPHTHCCPSKTITVKRMPQPRAAARHPQPNTPGNSNPDITNLIRFMQESRLQDEERRRRDEEHRRTQEEIRWVQQHQQRREDKFMAILQMLSSQHVHAAHHTTNVTPHPSSPSTTPGLPPVSLLSSPAQPPVRNSSSKPAVLSPPTPQADASFQVFRQWRRRWQDYTTMIDLANMTHAK